MDRNSGQGSADKAIQTVCVGGVYIIDKRMAFNRRHKSHKGHKGQKTYERRLSKGAKNVNRRRPLIDMFI